MSILTLLTVHLLSPPITSDREVAPVEIEAPAEASPEAAPVASPQPQEPAPAPASDATLYWRDAPAVAPPPAPPPAPKPQARPDRPIRWRVDIMGSLGGAVFRDAAWRAFDYNRSVLQYGVTVRGDTRLGSGRVFLGGGASFRRFASRGDLYDNFSTDILAREPVGFIRVSVAALEGVDAFAQAGGGVSIVDVHVYSSSTASQRAFAGLAEGLAGVALYLPKRWLARRGASRLTGGLELGAGYTWRGAVDVRPQVSTDDEPIPTSSAGLGDLALRGFTWRLGLFIRFQ
ncbi:MAG: hypothetical protein IPO88_22990 [Nannocystis sp.]|uniref:hypothetical protein n=1 Tax=Nannocystis sp. TaxID=1962667 RepID=UPI002421DB5F|nr:hypothetical protein [Nannocystis sp.]MBK9756310.1 hypothetical protein [Nannocystis sp.]